MASDMHYNLHDIVSRSSPIYYSKVGAYRVALEKPLLRPKHYKGLLNGLGWALLVGMNAAAALIIWNWGAL